MNLKITLSLKDIIEMKPSLEHLANMNMPAKTAYWIGKLYKKAAAEHQEYVDIHLKLVQKYGQEHEEKKGYFQVLPEKNDEFNTELNEVLDQKVVLEGVSKIHFQDIERLNISPAVMAGLEPVLYGAPNQEE